MSMFTLFVVVVVVVFPFIFIRWRLITLQYCSVFCHTMTWISHGFTCVPHPEPPSHLIFPLAISCLTTSNLSWFMDLTFQVPMQYCSLQHWNLLPSPVTSTTGCCFCFGSISSFFLDYFPTDSNWGVPLSVSYLSAFSYCSWGSQGKNTEVVCHSLLQCTMFC